jgi:flagellar hook-associated protein 2
MGISLSGLASGMDWKTTVSQLMAIERVPQDTIKSQKALDQRIQSAYDTLKTNLNALSSASTALGYGISSGSRVANVSAGNASTNASNASVTTSSGAAIGAYTVVVSALAKPSAIVGTSVLYPTSAAAQAKKLSEYGITEGTFTVNNTQYTLSAADVSNLTIGDLFGGGSLTLTPTGGSSGSVSNVGTAFNTTTGAIEVYNSTPGGSISMGSSGDTSNILSALGLSYDSGSSKYLQTISSAALANFELSVLAGASFCGSDTLTINGVSLGTISDSDTVGSVISKINSSSAGVTATLDPSSQSIRLTANSSDSSTITVSDGGSSHLADTLGLGATAASTRGSGVQFTLNGGATQSGDSNTINFSAFGFGGTSMSVTGTGTFNVQVSASAGDYKTKINTLISSYNTLKQMLDDSTKITVDSSGKVSASVFSNRTDINNLLSTIKSRVYTAVTDPNVATGTSSSSYPSLSSSYNTMGKIGIGFDSSGMMVINDQAKLDSALAKNPGAVDALFNSGSRGISLSVYNTKLANNKILVANPNLQVGQGIAASWLSSGTKITAVSAKDADMNGYYTVTLSSNLLSDPSGNAATYTPSTSSIGVAARLSALITNLTGTGGMVATATKSLSGQIKRFQDQIDAMDRSLALKEKQLTASFIAMESAQSKFQNMSSQITAAFK